jgi:tetratricopeptide (TPR) repeat protein
MDDNNTVRFWSISRLREGAMKVGNDPSSQQQTPSTQLPPDEAFQKISRAVSDGRLTLAEVGGFSEEELDGTYACACTLVHEGRLKEALEIARLLIILDTLDGRYYLLGGTALQGLDQLEAAEQAYIFAAALLPDSVRANIFLGETKIKLGKTDAGLECLQQGVSLEGDDPDEKELQERARKLIELYQSE